MDQHRMFTLHSLKSTALSWANQLAQKGLITEEQRRLQGHRRQASMRLYSRDDTLGQLALQGTLIREVQKGQRFVTPLHRGSQQPISEPDVELERFSKPYQRYVWQFFQFSDRQFDQVVTGLSAQQSGLQSTPPDGAEASGSNSSDSSKAMEIQQGSGLGTVEELVVARFSKVQRVMLACSDNNRPFWDGLRYRAACGARLPRDHCHFDTQINPEMPVCRHSACHSRWIQVYKLGL